MDFCDAVSCFYKIKNGHFRLLNLIAVEAVEVRRQVLLKRKQFGSVAVPTVFSNRECFSVYWCKDETFLSTNVITVVIITLIYLNLSEVFPAWITSGRWHWLGVTCSNHMLPLLPPLTFFFLSLVSLATRSQSACDSPLELRLYFTVSGLRHRHVLIKIQIPSIDCVIRRPQPRPDSIDPPCDLWSFSEEKSFCVIIWGNSLGRV